MNLEEALLRADEPRRPLDWRFQRALILCRTHGKARRPRSTDDPLIRDYADLLYRLAQQSSFPEMEKIRKKYPDLFRVHLTYATLNATELALTDAMLLCLSVDPAMVTNQTGMDELQQKYYRQMFLDTMDRRQMTSFIASQIMEPSKLRSTAMEQAERDDLEKAEQVDRSVVRGSFSERALRVLRLVGFYSSPVVVEMMYSGLLADARPDGRDSATKYMTQAYLTNVRRRGMMSVYLDSYTEDGIERFMKLAYSLAVEEQEDAQFDLMQNIDNWARLTTSRITAPGTIEVSEPAAILDVEAVPAPTNPLAIT